MPELPEVETMRRGILAVEGSQIVRVERVRCRRRPIQISPSPSGWRRVVGQKIAAVERVGKRVVLALGSGDSIVLEPRMTGLVLLAEPPTTEHLRLRIELTGGSVSELWFWDRRGLGTVRLMRPDEREERLGPAKLGPDALEIDAASLKSKLGRSRRAVKVALLDQRAVAGIGNLYAAEILFVAGVHPERRCDLLSSRQWQAIVEATHEVLGEAIRLEGSTLSDGTYRNALNQSGGYQKCHRVYDRAGVVCPRCGKAKIRRIVQTGRSTFFCPGCQKRRG